MAFSLQEQTKALTRFTWAMSLFGLQQTLALMCPRQSGASSTRVAGQSQPPVESSFNERSRAGQHALQIVEDLPRQMFNTSLSMMTLGVLGRAELPFLSSIAERGASSFRGCTGQQVPPADEAATGWGPVSDS